MLIFPAIDLLGGKCVRLLHGDYQKETVYHDDPIAVAADFESQGAKWLHVVDLDGAKAGAPENLEALRRICSETSLRVEFGGGVRSLGVARSVLDAGADRVIVGTKLAEDPELAGLMFSELGEAVVAGIDARDGKAATAGWLESTQTRAEDLAIRVEKQGAKRIILTDIGRDGALLGPNIEFLLSVSRLVGVPVIQSGGISSLEDIKALLALGPEAPEGVIVGRAIYENRFTVRDAIEAGTIPLTNHRFTE